MSRRRHNTSERKCVVCSSYLRSVVKAAVKESVEELKNSTVIYDTIFGEITNNEIPMIEIFIKNRVTGEEIITGYLTPFRGYRFQVSDTPTCMCDMGSSQIFEYSEEFKGLSSDFIKEMLRGQATIAIEEFISGWYVKRSIDAEHYFINSPKYLEPFYYGVEPEGFNKFIQLSAEWVMTIKW